MTQKMHEEPKFKKIHESAAMWGLHTVQGHQMKGQEPTSPYRESWRKVIILAISAKLNSRSSERHLHVWVWNICYISETKKMYSIKNSQNTGALDYQHLKPFRRPVTVLLVCFPIQHWRRHKHSISSPTRWPPWRLMVARHWMYVLVIDVGGPLASSFIRCSVSWEKRAGLQQGTRWPRAKMERFLTAILGLVNCSIQMTNEWRNSNEQIKGQMSKNTIK